MRTGCEAVRRGWAVGCGAVLVLLSVAAGSAVGAEVSVAVAANFIAPMKRIAAAFEQATGHRAALAFGSTGKLAAQIRNGAPFEVLLAADVDTPMRLEQEGLGVAGSRYTYAIGRLVLWSRQPDFVDAQGERLRRGGFDRLALADPKLAPYGAAAIETLHRLGLLASLRPKFVQGDSIAQAYQFVATGNAALGFVAQSQVYEGGRLVDGSGWLVPASLHAPLRQDALLLSAGKGHPAATALLDYLRSAPALAVLHAYGYDR